MTRRRTIAIVSLALVALLGTAATLAATAQAGTGCRVDYTVASQWNDGFTSNLTITNTGDRLNGWTLTLTLPDAGQRTAQSWDATFRQSGRTVTFTNADWNGSVAANGTVSFGFQGAFTGANPAPTDFNLNGVACGSGAGAASTASPSGTGAAPTASPNRTGAAPTASPTTSPSAAASSSTAPTRSASPSGTAPTRFTTLPPGAALPSGAQCAAWVRAVPIPENKGVNAAANRTTGHAVPAATGLQTRVDGNFTGTTAQILRWAACKWGLDEDLVKAQAAIESWWRMDTKGDWGTDATRCPPGHGLGADGKAGSCPESFGLLQIRYPFNTTAFPGAATSSAFNADYAYANWRSCYEGSWTWLNTVERGSEYRAGDAYGCMGVWFSGRWHTAAAKGYITRVKDYLAQRIWETPNFQQP